MTFKAVTIEYGKDTFNVREGKQDEHYADGFYPAIFNELKQQINFTYSLNISPDGQWGILLPNGTWTGMINYLQHGIFDISKLLIFNFNNSLRKLF